MGLYLGGLIIGRTFASEIWGAYFQEGLFWGELITGILQYFICNKIILILFIIFSVRGSFQN